MSKKILAIIETQRFPQEVARRAARIASVHDCDLDIVLSDPTSGFLRSKFLVSGDSKQIAETVRQAQEEQLARIVTELSEFNLDIQTTIVKDRPACDAIIAHALESEPLYVVKGTEYHSPAERARFTFNDWQLIRKLDFPLWLVKPKEWGGRPVIVAAVDPMHPTDKQETLTQAIVDSALSVADKFDGTLLLLHTYERLEEVSNYAKLEFKPLKVPVARLEADMRDEHQRQLEQLAEANGIGLEALHMLPGRTREILPSFSRLQNASLVIMGAVARTGLKRRAIGSTAEHVLDHVPCDILIARS